MKLHIPSIPHLVHIETTYNCNQRCLFCYNPRRDTPPNYPILDRIVQEVFEEWVPHVYLIGGEPSHLGTKRLNRYIELLAQRSSVTIVTNGQIYLDGISEKLACIGVPIHGIEATHDFLANKPGSFRQAVQTIDRYVKSGFDVRCIPVLTRQNYNQIYLVIQLAKELGMESVFVDRFEDGGLGSSRSLELKPSLEQFRVALGQMIAARDRFQMPVGWGTAIPFCLDKRLVAQNMSADCGAGVTFAAISPRGEVRVCNQSERVYGNILNQPLSAIWHHPDLAEFRDLRWIDDPCVSCCVLLDCLGGCKVDANCSDKFCIDYAVRGQKSPAFPVSPPHDSEPQVVIPARLRRFRLNRYTRLHTAYEEAYLVTRYQTILLDDAGVEMLRQVIAGTVTEQELIEKNAQTVEAGEVRRFVSLLILVQALDESKG